MGRKNVEYENVEYMPKNKGYLKGLNSGATYGELKAWIAENFDGMKVSSKYIGEIKSDCGMEKRENYNKGEGKSHDVKCPPEKREAILKAFEHFNMI